MTTMTTMKITTTMTTMTTIYNAPYLYFISENKNDQRPFSSPIKTFNFSLGTILILSLSNKKNKNLIIKGEL